MVGQLTIEMAANVARLERDMRSARTTVDGAMRSIQRSAQVAMRALGALGVGLGAMQITQFVRGAINAGDEMSKMAQRIGVTTDAIAGLQLAFRQGGSSVGEMQSRIGRLTKALADGNDGLKFLNITSTDTVGALSQIAERFQAMPDGAQKSALAIEIFGRSGANLIPILNQGSQSLRDYDALARQLGITVDTETGKTFEKFNDTLDTVSQSFGGIANQFAQELLPSMQAAADALLNFMMSLDIKQIAQTTIDILTVLSVLVAGRLISSMTSFAVTMATATGGMSAMGIAAGVLRGALSLLGGPVGVIASAAGLLYTFRTELGLTSKTTYDSRDAIDSLKDSVNNLSMAQTQLKITEVWNDLLTVNKTIESHQRELKGAQHQLELLTQTYDPLLARWVSSIGTVDEVNKTIIELSAAIETATGDSEALTSALQTLGLRAAGVVKPKEKATETTRDYGKAVKDVAAEMQKLIDQYGYETDALTMSQREKEYANFLRKMEAEGIKENTELWIKYTEAFLGAQNERQFVESVIKQNEEEKVLIQKRIDERLKQEDEYAREMEQINNQIGQSLTDALMNGGMKAKDMLLNLFKTLVLRPILQPIITGVTSMVMSGFAGSAAASGADSMSQGIGLFNAATAAKSVYDGVMGGFTSLGASFTNLGVDLGSQFIADFGYGFGQGFTTGGGVMANAGTMVGAAANAAAGIAGGIALGNMISGQFKVGGSQMATTATGAVAGAIIGSVVPVIGTAIGAIIGGALGGVVNRAFGMGGTTTENAGYLVSLQAMGAEVQQFEDWKKKGGWFRGDQTGRNITEAAQEVNELFSGAAMAIGSSVMQMAQAVGVSTDMIGEFAQNVVISTKGFTEEEFAKQVEGYLAGLETSLVDHLIPAIWEFGTIADKTAADILKRLSGSLITVNQAFEVLGYNLYEASLQGASAASKLVQLFGGIEGFTAATSFYYENFYSAQEKVNFQTEQLTKIFGSFNAALPETREQFRALVEMAQAAGNDVAFANLLQLAPAFDSLHTAMEQLGVGVYSVTEAISNSARDLQAIANELYSLETRLLTLQGNTAELRRRELEALDPSNRALQQQIYFIEDVKKAFEDFREAAGRDLSQRIDSINSKLRKTLSDFQAQIDVINAAVRRLQDASSATDRAFAVLVNSINYLIDNIKIAAQKTDVAFDRLVQAIDIERDLKIESYQQQYDDLQENLKNQLDLNQEIRNAANDSVNKLRSIFDTLQGGIDQLFGITMPGENLQLALQFISESLRVARAGGGLPEQGALSRAFSIAVAGSGPERFSSAFEMRRANLTLRNELIELQAITANELTLEEKQLQLAEQQIATIESLLEQSRIQFEQDIALADKQHAEQIAYFEAQLNALRGIDAFVLSVEQATAMFNQSMSVEQNAMIELQKQIKSELSYANINQEDLLVLAQSQIDAAQAQIDALRGVDGSVLTVEQATARLQSAMSIEQKATQDLQKLLGAENVVNQQELIGLASSTIEKINAQIEQSRVNSEKTISQMTAQHERDLAYFQNQINAMLGIDDSVKSLSQILTDILMKILAQGGVAVDPIRAAQVTDLYLNMLQRAPDVPGFEFWATHQGTIDEIKQGFVASAEYRTREIEKMYSDILNRDAESDGLEFWIKSANTLEEIRQLIATSNEAVGIPQYALGGRYMGGMALVGERGPELIDFSSPGMVYNNERLRSAMGGGDTAAELRALREDNRIQSRAMVSMQSRMAKVIEQWNGDGLPQERFEGATT